ncbi:hypothetical protein [Lelliottia wanjuensis]|uniref:hypothetical protein n=1 Tax=Lelliottia wanjuensis TaxID=3050585 RepID=UPI00254DAD5A|nr:hypothetical protein [Lelliottia sp. V86_10]MDK9583185.1 hypothetical protein [Lelliottia sp. V86_10]
MRIEFYDRGATAKIKVHHSFFSTWRINGALSEIRKNLSVNSFGTVFRTTVISGDVLPVCEAHQLLMRESHHD